MECEHKFVLKRSDQWYQSNGRYYWIYTSIDYFFCEKCLFERELKNQATCGDGRQDELPDWAKAITNRRSTVNDF